jgi:polyphosphate glucokinase
MNVLVIDIGGTHVKFLATGQTQRRQFSSGETLTPQELVEKVREQTKDWSFDAVSIGFPGKVGKDGPSAEPENLGSGWVHFDFAAAFGKPVKVINDAAMQALGSYEGGRMLFLGLGTGLGSTLVADRVVIPLELGQLPYKPDGNVVSYLGREGFKSRGKDVWLRALRDIVPILRGAFVADYVVLGGGSVKEVDPLPEGMRRGGNENAFEGGFRLWETEVAHADEAPAAEVWRVVR